ncbi:phosphoribosyltransferase domain-containing protein [Lachnospiraceae bacterium 46-61]
MIFEYEFQKQKNDMIGIAQRENNNKRNYLFVNRFQAKHVAVSPSKALKLFQKLGEKVYCDYKNKKTTMIGFAETATAIASAIAIHCPNDVYYIHTSREILPSKYSVVEFKEEHSHATQQILYCKKAEEMLFQSEKILFIEDEITTGKTILNFIEALQKKGIHADFGACSIINSMDKQHRDVFHEKNISLYALLNWNESISDKLFLDNTIVNEKMKRELPGTVHYITLYTTVNPRLGCSAKEYQMCCMHLAEQIYNIVCSNTIKSILILGTEECMYPAIFTGEYIEKKGICKTIKTHSTTRSPIVPRVQEQYPIFNRISFESLYEKGRKTYLYNLEKYDIVIIVTDAQNYNKTGEQQLLQSLKSYGNETVSIINWRYQ